MSSPPDHPPGRRFDAVLFDFSGVLTTSPFDNLAALEAEEGLTAGLLVSLTLGDYGTDGDHPWHELERGRLTVGDYFIGLGQRLKDAEVSVEAVTVLRRFGGLTVYARVVERIRELRAEGYRTALVTNNVKEFRDGWTAMVPVTELFDVVIDSSEEGVRKPNPTIYLTALERLGGVPPERAVFLDDQIGCVEGARAAGLTGILVGDPDVALADLDALLGRERSG